MNMSMIDNNEDNDDSGDDDHDDISEDNYIMLKMIMIIVIKNII